MTLRSLMPTMATTKAYLNQHQHYQLQDDLMYTSVHIILQAQLLIHQQKWKINSYNVGVNEKK